MNQNNLSSQAFEQIERYLLDEMSEQEKSEFEGKLETDEWLKNEVDLQRSFIAAIQAQTFLQELQHNKTEEAPKNRFIISKQWMVAATILALLAVAATWWMGRNSVEEKLYAKYYSVDPGLPTTMAVSNNYEFERGMVDYKQGNFNEALARWESLQSSRGDNDTLSYFIAMASFNGGDIRKASSQLKKVRASKSSTWHSSATWYLALANLKAGNKQAATELLKQIPSYDGASALLKELQER